MTDSLGGRLRAALATPDPAVSVTAVVFAFPAAYVTVAAAGQETLGFFALLLVGVRVPWLADSDVDGDGDADGEATAAIATPQAVLWTATTATLVAAALLGLYTAGSALGASSRLASALSFFLAWLLVEPAVGEPGR